MDSLYRLKQLSGILSEDKVKFLADRDGDRLLRVAKEKGDRKFTSGLDLVRHISERIPKKYLNWACRMYLIDESFRLEDLPEVQVAIQQFMKLQKVVDDFPRNIDEIVSIDKLYSLLEQHGDKVDLSLLRKKYLAQMNYYYDNDEADLDIIDGVVFYRAYTWEASRALRLANPDKVKLCTTYLDDSESFDHYDARGKLLYLLIGSTLFLLFFAKYDHKLNEFRDYANRDITAHLPEMCKKYPCILDQIKSDLKGNLPAKISFGLLETVSDDEMIEYFQKQKYDTVHRIYEKLKNPSKKIQEYLLSRNPLFVQVMEDPSVDQIVKAVEWNRDVSYRLKIPDKKMLAVLQHDPYIIRQVCANITGFYSQEQLEKFAGSVLDTVPSAISSIQNPSFQQQKLVVDNDPSNIQFIEHSDPKLQLHVLAISLNNFKYIRIPSDDALTYFIKRGGIPDKPHKYPTKYQCMMIDVNSKNEIIGPLLHWVDLYKLDVIRHILNNHPHLKPLLNLRDDQKRYLLSKDPTLIFDSNVITKNQLIETLSRDIRNIHLLPKDIKII